MSTTEPAAPDPSSPEPFAPELRDSIIEGRSPLTMAMMFYLVTVGAIISASLRTLANNEAVTSFTLAVMLISGAVVGLLVGGCVGFLLFRNWIAVVAGISVGLLTGTVAGALTLVNAENFAELVSIAFGGCWLLVGVMLVAARFRKA